MSEPMASDTPAIRAGLVVLPCNDLDATLTFFIERLGFRLDRITPADDPRMARISGHGLTLELQRGLDAAPVTLHLTCDDPAAMAQRSGLGPEPVAPNGTRVFWVPHDVPLTVPPGQQELVVCRAEDEGGWVIGRAGMQYRDRLPGRFGGRFIVSQIRIEAGGPVPDAVHFHSIRFQMIFCLSGWVKVAYEDQGPPMIMRVGDCFLQPPGIRHRVLESSPGLNVLEIGCPAEHDTHIDHELDLPTAVLQPEREFDGQRFVHHVAADGAWEPDGHPGWSARDTGIATATRGLAGVRALRAQQPDARRSFRHEGEFLFVYVLHGSLRVTCPEGQTLALQQGDSVAIPAGFDAMIEACSEDLQLLEVRLPPIPCETQP